MYNALGLMQHNAVNYVEFELLTRNIAFNMFYLFKHLNLLQQKINKTKEPKRSITKCYLSVALHVVLKIK